jgi:hypothetical protein
MTAALSIVYVSQSQLQFCILLSMKPGFFQTPLECGLKENNRGDAEKAELPPAVMNVSSNSRNAFVPSY